MRDVFDFYASSRVSFLYWSSVYLPGVLQQCQQCGAAVWCSSVLQHCVAVVCCSSVLQLCAAAACTRPLECALPALVVRVPTRCVAAVWFRSVLQQFVAVVCCSSMLQQRAHVL